MQQELEEAGVDRRLVIMPCVHSSPQPIIKDSESQQPSRAVSQRDQHVQLCPAIGRRIVGQEAMMRSHITAGLGQKSCPRYHLTETLEFFRGNQDVVLFRAAALVAEVSRNAQ